MNGESLLFNQIKYTFEVREKTHTLYDGVTMFSPFFFFFCKFWIERIHWSYLVVSCNMSSFFLDTTKCCTSTKVNMSITTSVKFMCATKSTCFLHEKTPFFSLCCRLVKWVRLVFQRLFPSTYFIFIYFEIRIQSIEIVKYYWSAQLPRNKWNA